MKKGGIYNHFENKEELRGAAFVPPLLVLIHTTGVTAAISFLHLHLRVPLTLYVLREVRIGRPSGSPTVLWSLAVITTLVLSLVFDVRDSIRWPAGNRGILDPGPDVFMPWVTIPALVVAFGLVRWYIVDHSGRAVRPHSHCGEKRSAGGLAGGNPNEHGFQARHVGDDVRQNPHEVGANRCNDGIITTD